MTFLLIYTINGREVLAELLHIMAEIPLLLITIIVVFFFLFFCSFLFGVPAERNLYFFFGHNVILMLENDFDEADDDDNDYYSSFWALRQNRKNFEGVRRQLWHSFVATLHIELVFFFVSNSIFATTKSERMNGKLFHWPTFSVFTPEVTVWFVRSFAALTANRVLRMRNGITQRKKKQ